MVISSRTPEGQPNHCPVCGSPLRIEPSDPAGDAPCPRCGHLLWFTWEDLGDIQVITPMGGRFDAESLDQLIDPLAMRSDIRLVIDFSNVRSLSAALLSKLILLKKRLLAGGCRLSLRNVQPDLVNVFRVSRIDRVLDLEP